MPLANSDRMLPEGVAICILDSMYHAISNWSIRSSFQLGRDGGTGRRTSSICTRGLVWGMIRAVREFVSEFVTFGYEALENGEENERFPVPGSGHLSACPMSQH
jgi:hypothetical protein